jgi:hypothetical protein
VTVDLWVGIPASITTGSVSVTIDGSTQFAQVTALSPPAGATSDTTGPPTTSALPDPTTAGDPTTDGPSSTVEAPTTEPTAPTTLLDRPSDVLGGQPSRGATDITGTLTAPTTEPTPSAEPEATDSSTSEPAAPESDTAQSSSSGPMTDGSDATESSSPPDPAHLALGQPEVERSPAAGGSGTVTFTVRNDGGETSAGAAVKLTLPSGMSAASIAVDGAHAGSGTSCTLPAIAPEESVTVTVTLAVGSDAQDGTARFDVPGDSARVDLTIDRPSPSPTPTATSNSDQPADRPEGAPVPAGAPVTASSAPPGS